MNIPVTLKVVIVTVDAGGNLTVWVDGVPYLEDTALVRDDLRRVLEGIASTVGEPVRVEVHESDGATFSDIVLPHDPHAADALPRSASNSAKGGIAGSGFTPGEPVAIAFVLAQQEADERGATTLHVPPVALKARPEGLVLVGMNSGRITTVVAAAS